MSCVRRDCDWNGKPECATRKETLDNCFEGEPEAAKSEVAGFGVYDRAKLKTIAEELQGYSSHIKEYLAGDSATLPMQWDIQDVYEKFKNAYATQPSKLGNQ